MADRIVVMNSGRIEQVGTPLELYDHPDNLFVAGFIGSPAMSFLEGRLENGAARLDDGTALPVAAPKTLKSGPVTLGIRPEAYRRDPEGPLTLTVEVVEPTGPEIHVFGQIAGTAVRAVFRDRMLPTPGETLGLSVPVEQVHLFDPESGDRLAP